MQFQSVTNYFLHVARILFAVICFIILCIILGLIRYPVPISSFIPWYARIIILIGMIWGMIFPTNGLFSGANKIRITSDTITINKIFFLRKKSYNLENIKQVKEINRLESDWGRHYGIRLGFENGDEFVLMSYNFLNYKELKKTLIAVSEKLKQR